MTEEGKLLYNEALKASQEMYKKLSHVKVQVPSDNTALINAIRMIFKDSSAIREDGSAVITYDMYRSIVNLIRDLGGITASEVLS